MLTGVEYHGTILSFTRADHYGRRQVTVKYDKRIDNFPDIDTIKMQSGKGGNATVLVAPLDEDEESLITSSQSSSSFASTEESEVASLAVTQTYCVEASGDAAAGSAVGCKWKPERVGEKGVN